MKRHHNDGLRKLCEHPRRVWAKCPDPWHMNYQWRGQSYRLSLDRELGRHVDSKTEAVTEADRIKTAIRGGRFRAPLPVPDRLTLRHLWNLYAERCLQVKRPARHNVDEKHAALILRTEVPTPTGERQPFGAWLVRDIKADSLEQFREARLATGGGRVAVNRNLGFLSALFNWALEHDHIDHTPFKKATKTVVRKTPELPRSRRLEDGEEEKLLAVCNPHLRALVVAGIETGCRLAELLSLQWRQVRGDPPAEIVLLAPKTKTRKDRAVPVSGRLRAVLDMRRTAIDGTDHPPDAYVFGNDIGQRVTSIKTAWTLAVLKAHGFTPERTKGTHALTPDSRATYQSIGLHYHDLRREAGSRWLEGGVPIQVVRDWLGHTNVAQTSTYLATTARTSADSMKRFEAGQAALQVLASSSETRGRKRPSSAVGRERKSNKTAVGRDSTRVH